MTTKRQDQKTSPEKLTRAQRREVAMRLRVEGRPYPEIARLLKVSERTAFRDIAAVMEETKKRTDEDAERYRALNMLRSEALIRALWPGRAAARTADSILRAMERESKLLGSDAPERRELTGKDGAPLVPAGVSPLLAHMTDDELEQLERLMAAAAARAAAATLAPAAPATETKGA